jgi:hypothetical protein
VHLKQKESKETGYILFDSVVVVVFQIAFRVEIHVNDVFLFFKNHF